MVRMGRILYGLCSVGMGHAVRSKFILEHLMKNNDVLVATSGESYKYLEKFFPGKLVDIEGFELVFKNNAIVNWKTVGVNFRKINSNSWIKLKKARAIISSFKPEVVVSDWEPFTSVYAKNQRLPLISIDNQHYIIFGDYKFPKRYFLSYLKARAVLQALMRESDHYIISLLPGNKLKKIKNKYGVEPIIRPDVLKLKTSKKGYVLVYQSTNSYEKLVKILKSVKEKFIVYGFGIEKKEDNLIFKKFSTGNKFTKDLAGCKAVIANGGFTLISEALYLRKPMLVIPIKKHFEQILNSLYVGQHKYGEFYEDLDRESLIRFLNNIEKYKIPKFNFSNNKKLLGLLDSLTKKAVKK